MRKLMLGVLFAFTIGICAPMAVSAATASTAKKDYQILPKPGEKIPIDADYYFTYGFDKQPKIGMVIMRVEIFTRDGKRDTSFVVRGDCRHAFHEGSPQCRRKGVQPFGKGGLPLAGTARHAGGLGSHLLVCEERKSGVPWRLPVRYLEDFPLLFWRSSSWRFRHLPPSDAT